MRAIIVGLGSIGQRHAQNLRDLGLEEIVGFDPDAERRERFAREIGGAPVTTLQEGLDTRPDLAVIASPNRFHVSQALECARSGCHLLIEKPLGHSRDAIDSLLEVIEEQRLFAHVGSNWKFHSNFQTVKRLIDQQVLGRITGAQILAGQWLPDWHPWEDYRHGYSARRDLGGGVVLDTHEFDYLTWLLGPAVKLVGFTAKSGALEIDTEDVACACLRLASGALVTIHIDYIQRQPRRRYHLSGDAGSIDWDSRLETIQVYRAGEQQTESIPAPPGDLNEMYVQQMRHVLDGAAGKVAPVTSVAAAAKVLDLQMTLLAPQAAA